MKIVSLSPFITDYIQSLGLGAQLVGVSHRCLQHPDNPPLPTLTNDSVLVPAPGVVARELALDPVDAEALLALNPDVVLTSLPDAATVEPTMRIIAQELSTKLNKKVVVASFFPTTLNGLYQDFENIGELIGARTQAHERTQRIKAQLMNWSDNFYDRMKNKKVTFLSSFHPLTLAGWWIPDMIHLCSATSQVLVGGEAPVKVSWAEIVQFGPDVIVFAPEGKTLKESMATFKEFEKLPGWEDVPAVKRGQVAFVDGDIHFYKPGNIIGSMGILVSAIAGFDSGYITDRDSFFRLRWLEMQRHRL